MSPDIFMPTGKLYESYRKWCEGAGQRSYSNIWFGRQLSDRGFCSEKVSGGRCWVGIGVKHAVAC